MWTALRDGEGETLYVGDLMDAGKACAISPCSQFALELLVALITAFLFQKEKLKSSRVSARHQQKIRLTTARFELTPFRTTELLIKTW